MQDIQIFENPEFGEIRALEIDNEPWFVGKDVATALGYERGTKAVQDHVDLEDKRAVPIQDSTGRMQNTPIINESGLYSLILSSKLPSAKRFRRWVTSEVLPSIRKTGGYIQGQEALTDEELLERALIIAQRKIEEKDQQLKKARPKILFANAVAVSDGTISIADLAKLLYQNGVKIGQNRLFELLREKGYLIRKERSDKNMPTQRAMEMGLFRIKESIQQQGDKIVLLKTVKVTGKGQRYFINKFLNV